MKELQEKLYAIHNYKEHTIYEVSLQNEIVILKLIPYYEEWEDKDLGIEEYDFKSFMENLHFYTFIRTTYDFILRRYMFKNNVKTGWISFDGEFHPCDRFEHESFARLYLEKTSQELENEGWLKIERNDDHSRYIETFYENPQVMTNVQENTLIRLGFQDKDYKDWMILG